MNYRALLKSPGFWLSTLFLVLSLFAPYPYRLLLIASAPLPALFNYMFRLLQRRAATPRVDENLIFLITHMAAVATGKPPSEKLFNLYNVSGKGYGVYMQYLRRITELAKKWGYGFVAAIQFVAKNIANQIFRDFLTRFSETMNVGEDLETFLTMEHQSMFVSYEADYARVLEATRILMGIYTASISSALFININMMLISTLFLGTTSIILASFIATVLALALLLYLIRRALPKQEIVHDLKINIEGRKLFFYSLLISTTLSSFVGIVLSFIYGQPPYFLIVFGLFSLVPGVIGRRIERKVKNVENFFVVFIRSLGLTYSTLRNYKQSLKSVLRTDFGDLTKHIRKLYTRLSNGVDRRIAIYYFIGETGSESVRRGMDIFYDAVESGGDAAKVSELVSITLQKMINLRKQREQVATAFQGVIYFLHIVTVALAEFVFSLTLLFQQLMQTMGTLPIEIIPVTPIEPGFMAVLKILLVFTLTLLNAFAIQFARGGFIGSAWLHIAILMILSGTTMIIASTFTETLMKTIQIGSLTGAVP